MLSIEEIKAANDASFGLISELTLTPYTPAFPGAKYGSEYARFTYFAPTGKEIGSVLLVRNSSNKGEWYYQNGESPKGVILEELPNFGGTTKEEFRRLIKEADERNFPK